MKKRLIPLFLLITVLFLLLGHWDRPEQRIPRLLGEKLDVSLKGSELLYFLDTHGGFHGDGTTVAVLRVGPKAQFPEHVGSHPNWHPLPMESSFREAVNDFAIFRDEEGNSLELPTPQQGWYYFRDRHSQSTDRTDPADLFRRGSLNFDLAIYDAGEETLWFFAADT